MLSSMRVSRRVRLALSVSALLVLVAAFCCVRAFAPPPVFEHKAERNYKGTNCEACQAAIKQAIRKMPTGAVDLSTQKSRRAREQKVSDIAEGLCTVENFGRYEFSPPTMVSACNDFLSSHGEELEELLYKGVATDVEMRTKLCLKTKLCPKLWDAEAEEQKRDRSPEESRAEGEAAARRAREEEKKKKDEEKAKKAEKAKAKKEQAEAAKAKRLAEEEQQAAAAGEKTEL